MRGIRMFCTQKIMVFQLIENNFIKLLTSKIYKNTLHIQTTNKQKMGKIIENYSMQQQLGEGVYGKVYKAVHMKTKQQVAIKVIHADKFKQIPKLQECTVNQINILSTMQTCPYIVKYIDMLKTVNNFYFVYQFCNGGTLDKLMQKQGPFPQKRALIYFRQMIQAFKILSKNNIMHRDLKPDNILMHNGSIKLGDFGFCKPLQSSMQMANTMLGSPIYMAPQVLKGQTYNMKADIWSLGVVLFQMIYGKCPFESKSIAKLIKLLDQEDLIIPQTPKLSLPLRQLLKRMLVKDFNSRIDWPEIFQYTFTQSGDIFGPKTPQLNQFQLRSSIKSSTGFNIGNGIGSNSIYSSPLTSSNNLNQSQSNGQSTNISMSSQQSNGVGSPKINKTGQQLNQYEAKNLMMKKKSPMKNQTDVSISSQYKSSPYYKNQIFNKNQRTGRIDMLIKNHGKLISIEQIAIDSLKGQKQKVGSLAIAYLLFKSVDKQIVLISEGLKKQPYDLRSDEFRQTIDKQVQSIRQIIGYFRQCIIEEDAMMLVGNFQEPNKMRIMKYYFENSRMETDEEVILAAQIVDYLDEGMLIKRDSYEKMGKDTLLKQVKNKFTKYI